jgi:hypothetical protein
MLNSMPENLEHPKVIFLNSFFALFAVSLILRHAMAGCIRHGA